MSFIILAYRGTPTPLHPPTAAHGLAGCHNPQALPPPSCTLHFLILLHMELPPTPPSLLLANLLLHTLAAGFAAVKLLTRLMHLYQKSRAALLCVVCESLFEVKPDCLNWANMFSSQI